MENKKTPINQNQGSSNNASGSGTNPAISEQEKEVKRTEYLNKIIAFTNSFLEAEITAKEWQNNLDNFFKTGKDFFNVEELREIAEQAEQLAGSDYETDSEAEESSSEDGYWEEASDQDQIKAEQAWQKQELERIKKDSLEIEARKEEQRKEQAKIEKKWEEQEQEKQLLASREKQLAKARREKAVSVDNKAVIKAEISQELTAIKARFENIKISETAEARINYKVNKEVDKLKNSWDGQNLAWNVFSMIPVAGNLAAPIHAAEHSKKLEAALKKQVKEAFPEIVKKLVNEATSDLNNQTTQALTKLDTLITARNQEVEQAQRAILHMEKVISELKEQNQDQSKKSERDIADLQKEIGKLVNQLKDWKEREERLKAERAKKLTKENLQKINVDCKNPKPPMTNSSERIKELEKELEEMRFTALVFKESEEQRALELKDEKESHERTKTRLTADLTAKQNELERVKATWQEVYDLEKKHKENAQAEIKKLQTERANKVEREASLEAKNKNLKIEKNTLENKVKELEETIKGLQPSYAYQLAEKFGIIKLKNTMVSIAVIIGLLAIIYVISLVLKYIAKPAWLNLAGFFPKSKKPKVITVVEEQEEEEAEDEIFEIEEKPKLAKKVKVLRSNTKVKPKSKTK